MEQQPQTTQTTACWVGHSSSEGRSSGWAVLRPRARQSMGDPLTRTLELYQFLESERWTHSEALAVQCGASHVFAVAEGLPASEGQKMEATLSLAGGEDGAGGPTYEMVWKVGGGGGGGGGSGGGGAPGGDVLGALRRLAGGAGVPLAAEGLPLAVRAAGVLLSRCKLLKDAESAADGAEGALGTYAVVIAGLGDALRLDASAVRSLNLLPGTAREVAAAAAGGGGSGGGGSSSAASTSGSSSAAPGRRFGGAPITSVHALLSKGCRTKGGARLLKSWMLAPLVAPAAIRARQDMVEAFATSPALRTGWASAVAVADNETLAARFARRSATLGDLLKLYAFATQLRNVVGLLRRFVGGGEAEGGGKGGMEDCQGEGEGEGEGEGAGASGGAGAGERSPILSRFTASFVEPLESQARDFGKLQEMVESLVVDVGDAANPRVKPAYSPELTKLDRDRRDLKAEIEDVHERATRSDWGCDLDLRLMHDGVKGHVFRAHKNSEKGVRAAPGVGAGDIQVLKDGIYFSTPKLARLSAAFADCDAAYKAASKGVVEQAVGVAATYLPVMEGAGALVAELDAYAGMGHVVANGAGEYVRPALRETPAAGGPPRLVKVAAGRHPVMELQEGVSFIPNDYSMGEGAAGEGAEDRGGGEGAAPAAAPATAAKRPRLDASADVVEGAGKGGRFHIITGPNMGGKSTYIRTLGVLVVMAQVCYCYASPL